MGEVEDQSVFYNPAQVVNRDLSVCALEVFSRQRRSEPRRRGGTTAGITILEALSATGLRAIRYYKEISNVRYIIANDLDEGAVQCIERNCVYNDVPVLHPTLHANLPDEAVELYGEETKDEAGVLSSLPLPLQTDARHGRGQPPSEGACATRDQDTHTDRNDKKEEEGCDEALTAPPRTGIRRGGGVIPNVDDANDLMHRLATHPRVHGAQPQRLCLVSVPPPPLPTAAVPTERGALAVTPPSSEAVCDGAASAPMLRPVLQQEKMDVVDLDPYGTAAPFLDAAFRCIKEGGLMLVTSTDSAILCGNYPGTCHAKYNSLPYKRLHCHEMAVRILLAAAERVANKHGKYIVPLVSLHIDFYVRCVFRVYTQLAEVKLGACKLAYQLQCTHCPAYWIRPMTEVRAPRRRAGAGGHKRSRDTTCDTKNSGSGSGNPASGNDADACRAMGDGGAKESINTAVTPRIASPQLFPLPPDRAHDAKVVCTTLHVLSQRHTAGMPHAAPTNTAASFPHGGAAMCPLCGSAVALSGPIYAAATQNTDFVTQILAVVEERAGAGRLTAAARVGGLLRTALEELPQCPLFYEPQEFSSYVRVRCPSTPSLVGALHRLGYRCSQVHCSATGLKTDCPPDVLMGVMLQWRALCQDDGETEEEQTRASSSSSSSSVPRLCVAAVTQADFSYDKKYDYRRTVTGITKFVPNAPGWGPKRRHVGVAATGVASLHLQ